MIDGRIVIRACLVSFRTETADVEALVEQTVAVGRRLHAAAPAAPGDAAR